MKVGDIILTRSTSLFPRLIRLGERIHLRGRWCRWNHAGLVVDDSGGTIEAWAKGVVNATVGVHSEYVVLDSKLSDEDRRQAIAFARSCLGDRYGYVTILSMILDLFTPNLITFRRPRTLICSELVARALEHGGWISPALDTSTVMPSDLARWFET